VLSTVLSNVFFVIEMVVGWLGGLPAALYMLQYRGAGKKAVQEKVVEPPSDTKAVKQASSKQAKATNKAEQTSGSRSW